MKKIISNLLFAVILSIPAQTFAFDLSELLKSVSVEDMIDGVFSTTNIEIQDLAGEWTSIGSAVSFQSENFLNKAGGIAAASTIESKVNPYFEKFGLTGAVFSIQTDGSFSLKTKKITLTGVFTKTDDGNFIVSFNSLGRLLGDIKTYIQKTSSSMDIMFDASKLQSIVSAVASLSKIKTVETLSGVLNSYDGICIGFKLENNNKTINNSSSSDKDISTLFNMFRGDNDSQNTDSTSIVEENETTESTQTSEKSTTTTKEEQLNSLKELFNKRK